mmetsp:Transcript_38989/g.63166  ORF Transcript_38989/g.63166 Transcript_38989/m.63166 type:complete len:219 (-) Transcript_38989:332-988(-)
MPKPVVHIQLVLIKVLNVRPEGRIISQDHLNGPLFPIPMVHVIFPIPNFLEEPMAPRCVLYTEGTRIKPELVLMRLFTGIHILKCPGHNKVISWIDHILNAPLHICDDRVYIEPAHPIVLAQDPLSAPDLVPCRRAVRRNGIRRVLYKGVPMHLGIQLFVLYRPVCNVGPTVKRHKHGNLWLSFMTCNMFEPLDFCSQPGDKFSKLFVARTFFIFNHI